jgi:hypothetical protein
VLDRAVTVPADDGEEGAGWDGRRCVDVERRVVGARAAPPEAWVAAWWAGWWWVGAVWWLTGVAVGLPGWAGALGVVAVVVVVVDVDVVVEAEVVVEVGTVVAAGVALRVLAGPDVPNEMDAATGGGADLVFTRQVACAVGV